VKFSRKRLPLETLLFAIMGAAISIVGWQLAVAVERADHARQHEAAFSAEASARITALQQIVSTELEAVRSLVSFYQASEFVSADEFSLFVSGSLKRHPGLRALEWAAVVPRESRAGVEASLRSQGADDFAIHPPHDGQLSEEDQGPHVAVLFAEPRSSNQSDLGLDLAAESSRRSTLDAARSTGALRISPPLRLDPTATTVQGFLAAAPVFAPGTAPTGQVERDSALSGYAVGVFDSVELVRASLGRAPDETTPTPPLLVIHIWDVSRGSEPAHILSIQTDGSTVQEPGPQESAAHSLDYRLDVGGRTWDVQIATASTHVEGTPSLSWFVLLGGLSVTVLVTSMVQQRVNHAHDIEERVRVRTAQLRATTSELAEREGLLRAVFEYTEDAILITGPDGTIRTANPAATQMFGAVEEALTGVSMGTLFTDPAPLGLTGHKDSWSEPGVLGLELEARRQTGSTFPAELTLTDFPTPEGPALLCVVRDITVRQEVDQMKRAFLATVNHELRTPLTSVLSSLELLSSGVAGEMSEQAIRMVTLASSNGERLLRLINDILDLDRLDEPSTSLRSELVDPGALLTQAVHAHQALSRSQGVALMAGPLPDQLPLVIGDTGRLEQVLGNLLGNALKFTPSGGRVRADLEVRERDIVFGVHDNGPGIPSAYRERIFERFTQVDDARAGSPGGSGLGLSIVQSIVRRHGGEVWLVCPEDGGASFFVSLPVAESEKVST